MPISVTEPSSVILSQTNEFKSLKSDVQKMPKQAKATRDDVINLIFIIGPSIPKLFVFDGTHLIITILCKDSYALPMQIVLFW